MIYGPHELSMRGWSVFPALARLFIWFFARDFLTINFNVDFYKIPDDSGKYALRVCTWNRRIILTYCEYTKDQAERMVFSLESEMRGNLKMRSVGFKDQYVDYVQVMNFSSYHECVSSVGAIIKIIRRELDAPQSSVQQSVL